MKNLSPPHKTASFPPWLRRRWPASGSSEEVRETLATYRLNTVCRSAQCPNQGECWSRGTATFMILGNICTRNCAFCGVHSGVPSAPEADEPQRIALAVARLKIRHVVLTSVTRDDLEDGGSAHFCSVIAALRAGCPEATVEVLTPDFNGDDAAPARIARMEPDVFAHNIETVARLHPMLRDIRASYETSLSLLRRMRDWLPARCHVKSGCMVGCGESEAEVLEALSDLRSAGCDAVTIGQYLKPSNSRLAVHSFVTPEQFALYEQHARGLGFGFVMSGPFVRSSYHADALSHSNP